ncbi:hypothetical protein CVT26_007215 [Gymnopilus dilepis]|uniref:Uncharacterized protein n=1 Tax=Gymnopilus dilepis TaxID=231916 RepID=A0A409W6I4_9AGAR|nr:hypothetical protein CVT26_007215 [Gymnopilus dilepis]
MADVGSGHAAANKGMFRSTAWARLASSSQSRRHGSHRASGRRRDQALSPVLSEVPLMPLPGICPYLDIPPTPYVVRRTSAIDRSVTPCLLPFSCNEA